MSSSKHHFWGFLFFVSRYVEKGMSYFENILWRNLQIKLTSQTHIVTIYTIILIEHPYPISLIMTLRERLLLLNMELWCIIQCQFIPSCWVLLNDCNNKWRRIWVDSLASPMQQFSENKMRHMPAERKEWPSFILIKHCTQPLK